MVNGGQLLSFSLFLIQEVLSGAIRKYDPAIEIPLKGDHDGMFMLVFTIISACEIFDFLTFSYL